jgi:enoyl-CoA hydratase/carnithine racemase
MILTGELIDAAEALRTGLIHRMVTSREVMDTALGLAQDIASKSPLAISYVKEALYNGIDLSLDQGMRMELDLYLLLFSTQDRVEGIEAFKEKRKPRFEGA